MRPVPARKPRSNSGSRRAPTAPANLTARAASSGEIGLQWTASSDNVGVTGYVVYRAAAGLGEVSADALTYQDTSDVGPGPTGIRNGGLLLVLVALAAVMALVDQPPEPGVGGRVGGGISQHLPPPAGITGIPPVGAGPSVPPAGETLAAPGGAGERPASSGRAHPRRQHPRPLSGRAAPASREEGAPEREGSPRPVGSPAPVHTPQVAVTPAARVRVPPVAVRVTPPAVLGRSRPEVEVATPEVSATVDEAPRLRLR